MRFHYLVIGGGVIGLSLARNLARRGAAVGLIEKDYCGAHASGRNSGVIHAGIYYDAGSAKAKYCVQGNQMLTDFCKSRGLPFQNIGKIIAPKDDSEAPAIDLLYQKSVANGADVKIIDYHEAKSIEPRIKPQLKYLWSPATSIGDNKAVIEALKTDCGVSKVTIMENTKYLQRLAQGSNYVRVKTSKGDITANYLINCAGVYTDKIAHEFGFGLDYAMLPFKGVYLYGKAGIEGFRTLVYPCPTQEFLGVHTTNTTAGETKLGPTAIPIFWREHYSGFDKFNLDEVKEVLRLYICCLQGENYRLYRNLLFKEIRKYVRYNLVADIKPMLERVFTRDYPRWGNPGIFPQLVDKRTGLLKSDFLIESDETSMHLLNIVSPGWTSALAFTDAVEKLIR